MNKNKQQCLLGIDIGTGSSKGVLTKADGSILAVAVVQHETKASEQGHFEHDAEAIWIHDCKQLIKELLKKSKIEASEISGIAFSAIGPCVLPVDEFGAPLCPAILYGIDTRAQAQIDELNARYGEAYILSHCGNALSSQAAGPKILWIRQNRPEIFCKARYFMTASSYLVFRLTGRVCMDYYTAGAGYTPLFDYKNLCWDPDICAELGCQGKLPELLWSSERAGFVTSHAAEEFGLAEGTPVCTGTCDAAAEAVSVGVVEHGQTMLMLGSTAFIISVQQKPVFDERLWSAPWLFPNTWALLGGMSCAGMLTQWFVDQYWREGIDDSEEKLLTELANEAEKVAPCADGLIALPYFCGERTPLNDPNAKGVLFGLTLKHTRGHLYRAFLESVACGIRHNFEVMNECGCHISHVRSVGGGTKNRLWLQIISDVTNVPQSLNKVTFGACYGDAWMAALSNGLLPEKQAQSKWDATEATVEPDSGHTGDYHRLYCRFRELYNTLKGMM